MGDNKISEAAVEAVAKAIYSEYHEMHNAPWDKEYDSVRQHWRKQARAALEAALPHLQGEAVPDKGPWEVCAGEPGSVISDDFTHDVMLRVHGDFGSDEALANYCAWLVGRLNHPQPAELSEQQGVTELVELSATLHFLATSKDEFPDWPDGWDWERIDSTLRKFKGGV